ncbi:efflux RND transporter periplasmic adaptor subunit, partial [Pseudoalteromonas ruthenica]|uniref:efflux RND transporter periplasmic adaptor subunit n=1 Tax=Pseudoalteromonas ruthenica TaxID=151081 RepID=UPI001287ADC7
KVRELAIVAPVSGVVVNHCGQHQAAGAPTQALKTVIDISAVEPELQGPESYANELGVGQAVDHSSRSEQLVGELDAISPEVIDRQVRDRVRFTQREVWRIRPLLRISARMLLAQRADG